MDSDKLQNIRHSTAHLLATAVKQLWPNAKNAIGPAIENGFYQDFDMGDIKLSDEDFPKIETKMHELLKEWKHFVVKEVSVEQAKKDFAENPYKLELIEEFEKQGKTITENNPGNFLDLCKGGHAENPQKEMKYFKLLSIAGAYWRGDEKNKMLTRIYGTAFESKKELDDYLEILEEAKKRDHKKLGRELELFYFDETAPGMTYWLPKGFVVYNTLYNFTREMYQKYGYQEVMTPQINKKDLYETSGHWFHYRDDMFISPMSFLREESKEPLEGSEVFGIKPMNCPNAMNIFKMKTRSYNDLPMRLAETSMLHRFELSGTLN
jgi:threonyl-tRNA synthetase